MIQSRIFFFFFFFLGDHAPSTTASELIGCRLELAICFLKLRAKACDLFIEILSLFLDHIFELIAILNSRGCLNRRSFDCSCLRGVDNIRREFLGLIGCWLC